MTHHEQKSQAIIMKIHVLLRVTQWHFCQVFCKVSKSGQTGLSQSHCILVLACKFSKHLWKTFGSADSAPMAQECSFSMEDLLCSVCCEVFDTPVILSCKHSFCKTCIQTHWDRMGTRQCPLCRRTERSTRPPINMALKLASDVFRKNPEQFMAKPVERCSIHNEQLKLFCRKDAELICIACTSSRSHKNHEYCPIADAASDIMVRKHVNLYENESYVICC